MVVIQFLSAGKMCLEKKTQRLLVWYSPFTAIPAVCNLDMNRDEWLPHSRQLQVQHLGQSYGDTVSEFNSLINNWATRAHLLGNSPICSHTQRYTHTQTKMKWQCISQLHCCLLIIDMFRPIYNAAVSIFGISPSESKSWASTSLHSFTLDPDSFSWSCQNGVGGTPRYQSDSWVSISLDFFVEITITAWRFLSSASLKQVFVRQYRKV